MQLYDTTLEQRFLSALIKYPQEYLEIQSLFSEDDIYSKDSVLHRTIFTLIKQSVEKGEDVEATILSQRALNLGIKFDEELPVGDYIISLSQRNVAAGSVEKFARELKKLSIRRSLAQTGKDIEQAMMKLPPTASYAEIIAAADKIFNNQVNHFDSLEDSAPVNIYDDMEYLVENAGLEQKEEIFGKFELVNKIYGSLHEPGNITTIIARSAAGKTTLALDECCYVGDKYGIPVLHFDNGEMSKEELQYRRISAISCVPHYIIKKGLWRNNPETTKKVRDAIKRIKEQKSKFYYHCMAGMSADEMISVAKKFYYKEVGRGKRMIISFDYIKPPEQNPNGSPEWQVLGQLVNKLKQFIQKEVLFEKKPMISLFTSAQANRSGVVTNKTKDKIVDDESIISGADRIIHYSSHCFILRKKTTDEILEEGVEFGTHKFIRVKARHLGEDVAGDLEPVKYMDTLTNNFINLEFKNFSIEERGDLRQIARKKQSQANPKTNTDDEPIDF